MQRFGGALNLNVHFQCVIPDGVFVREGEGTRFIALPGPSDEDVQEELRRIVRRVRKLLRPSLDVAQVDARAPDALAAAQADSVSLLRGGSPYPVRLKRQAAYLEYGAVKMNVDTDTQYAFTRAVADHMFRNYQEC